MVALHRAAKLLGYRKADEQFIAFKVYEHKALVRLRAAAPVYICELRVLFQAVTALQSKSLSYALKALSAQNLAASCTASLENVAAGLGLHAGTEAVNLFALTIFGLVGH